MWEGFPNPDISNHSAMLWEGFPNPDASNPIAMLWERFPNVGGISQSRYIKSYCPSANQKLGFAAIVSHLTKR